MDSNCVNDSPISTAVEKDRQINEDPKWNGKSQHGQELTDSPEPNA